MFHRVSISRKPADIAMPRLSGTFLPHALGVWGGAVAVCIEREIFPAVVLAQPHSERILGCFPHEWQSSGGTLQASCNAAVGLWAKVLFLPFLPLFRAPFHLLFVLDILFISTTFADGKLLVIRNQRLRLGIIAIYFSK